MTWDSTIPPSLALGICGIDHGHLALPLPAFFLCASSSFSSSRPASKMPIYAMPMTWVLEPLRGMMSGSALEKNTVWWGSQINFKRQGNERGNEGTVTTEGSPSEGAGKSFEGVLFSKVTIRSNMKTGRNCIIPQKISPELGISAYWELDGIPWWGCTLAFLSDGE